MTLTFGSLFSGIGGIDLGLQRAGFQIAWQVEIDEYASQVLAKHWPDVARFRDIRDCGRHNLSHVDLIAGGFPCQPHSLAGKRRASADDRDLWDEFYRIICELRPRWVVAENVPGLLSSEDGRFFGRVLRDLATCGYDAEWQVLSAAAVGAPHLRERIFLVAYPSRDAWELQQSQRQDIRDQSSINGTSRYLTNVADADRQSLAVGQVFGRNAQQELAAFKRSCGAGAGIWATESPFCGVADGIPRRVDRLRGLGNAVVPQVAEYVGRCILASVQAECEVSA